ATRRGSRMGDERRTRNITTRKIAKGYVVMGAKNYGVTVSRKNPKSSGGVSTKNAKTHAGALKSYTGVTTKNATSSVAPKKAGRKNVVVKPKGFNVVEVTGLAPSRVHL